MNQFYSAYGQRIRERLKKNQRANIKVDRTIERQRSRSRQDQKTHRQPTNVSNMQDKTSRAIPDERNSRQLSHKRQHIVVPPVSQRSLNLESSSNAVIETKPSAQHNSGSFSIENKKKIIDVSQTRQLNEVNDIKDVNDRHDQLSLKGQPIIERKDNQRCKKQTTGECIELQESTRQRAQKQNYIRQQLPIIPMELDQLERRDIASPQNTFVIRRYPYQAFPQRIQRRSKNSE